jgi:hypothetical protein
MVMRALCKPIVMTPKEILRGEFERTVNPWLESLGFVYSRSQFCYKRMLGHFEQRISILLTSRSSRRYISFSSAFGVHSAKYNEWLKTQGRELSDGGLAACAEWNVPGWERESDEPMNWNFADPSQRPRVLAKWRTKCETVGLPYLAAISSWEGAADDLLRQRCQYDKAADFFQIAGVIDHAIAALRKGIEQLDSQDLSWSDKSHPILIAKKKRQVQERNAQRLVFEDRIGQLVNSKAGDATDRPIA